VPTYVYTCKEHGTYEITKGMSLSGRNEPCPLCGVDGKRVYGSPPVIFHADGFHQTDYGRGRLNRTGDKTDNLNRNWSQATGETPPPPATDVSRNSGEKQ